MYTWPSLAVASIKAFGSQAKLEETAKLGSERIMGERFQRRLAASFSGTVHFMKMTLPNMEFILVIIPVLTCLPLQKRSHKVDGKNNLSFYEKQSNLKLVYKKTSLI